MKNDNTAHAQIGIVNTLEVAKEVPFGWYLIYNGEEILLPRKYTPDGLAVGHQVPVFVYRDSEDRLLATTQTPKVTLHGFAALRVVDTHKHGAFLDWGLEKDLFVPLKEQYKPMQVGETHVVRLCLDHKTDRLIGVAKIGAFFSKDVTGLHEGDPADMLVFGFSELGAKAIVNNQYAGVLYHSELFKPVRVGQRLDGYINKVREDGKIDLTLRKPGFGAIDDAKQTVLAALQKAGGKLPVHDKTDADVIRQRFGMSKKDFKKAIGGLYKAGLVKITPTGIEGLGK